MTPGTHGPGYKIHHWVPAQAFFQQMPFTQDKDEQTLCIALLTTFRGDRDADLLKQSLCGLSLRCWVSHPILKACMKLANLFGAAGQFTYRDLLPFVLTDDGRSHIVINPKTNEYSTLQETGELEKLDYTYFSLDVLQTYRLSPGKQLSLMNWVYLQTKQHPELLNYLAEFGFQKLSDWALLNRVREGQLKQLSERDRTIVTAFHAVYRRDRRLHLQSGRCPDPTSSQLDEINGLLQVPLASEQKLLQALRQIATQLRQFDIWKARESLDYVDSDSGQSRLRADLPTTELSIETAEESALMAMFHHQLMAALKESLQQSLTARIAKLKKSKKYGPFADKFAVGLQYYYREGRSLKEIAPLLGMSSWDQARRILNPGEFLNGVRSRTIQQFLDQVLATVQQKSLAPWPPSPSYLEQLSEQLEAFADAEIFQAAATEMKAGSHRNLNSIYAKQLLLTLDLSHIPTH
ncbi:MAG: hypothetical protein AAFY72_13000 [Cyanobacteria bacterium J06649_4]